MVISKSTSYSFAIASIAMASILTCTSQASANNTSLDFDRVSQTSSMLQVSDLEHFKPRPSQKTKINYDVWSQVLDLFVVGVGPSIRTRSKAYDRGTGTRFKNGINEPYRLETNKVLYPHMQSEVRSYVSAYADELETLGSQIDIPALERNQQLAYWINLHNAVIVREISKHYPGPKRRSRDITPIEGSATGLHSAKLINIDGMALSLEDIRQRIVYPNWKDPDVAFAFYLGDISSPSLRYEAYDPNMLASQLQSNSEQYVNSLLGMEKGKVSRIYQDIAPWYFQNFEPDLATYFKKRMRPEVFAEYERRGYRGANTYQAHVNDITSGRGKGRISPAPIIGSGEGGSSLIPIDNRQFRIDVKAKVIQLRKKEWFKNGTVTIEDVETNTGVEIK